MHKTRAL